MKLAGKGFERLIGGLLALDPASSQEGEIVYRLPTPRFATHASNHKTFVPTRISAVFFLFPPPNSKIERHVS